MKTLPGAAFALCLLATLAFAADTPPSFKTTVQSLLQLLIAELKRCEQLEIQNHALRQALGPDAAQKAIDAEMAQPPFILGDTVDFQTANGPVKGKLTNITGDDITVTADNHDTTIPLEDLKEWDRRRFGFKPDAYLHDFITMVEALPLDAQAQGSGAGSTTTSSSADTSPGSPDGTAGDLVAGPVKVTVTEKSARYVHFAWTVTITNRGDHDTRAINVVISARDKNDKELGSFTGDGPAIPLGDSAPVSSATLIETPLWNQIDHYTATVTEYGHKEKLPKIGR